MKLSTPSSSYTSSSSPSSSSFSSSSTTLSFDPTLCHSKSATAGCLTAILRRILCSGGLQTHPSDQITKLDSISTKKAQELKDNNNTEATSTTTTSSCTISPTLVARLMGLDSMGEKETTSSSSLSRSKSMNSVDYLGECKRMEEGLLHKRVKSSSSFREVPTFHLLESENFLVLSFEGGSESKELKSKGRRKEKGPLNKNKREKVVAAADDEEEENLLHGMCCATVACSVNEGIESEATRFSHPLKRKDVSNGEKGKRRKKRTTCYGEKKKVENECSSEDSSPVSVFDFHREASGTEEDSFGVGMSWRRKLAAVLENDQPYIQQCDSNLMMEERKDKAIENHKHEGSKKKECVDIWGDICKLVEDELRSNHVEGGIGKQSDLESVSEDLESQIFDHLLNELVDQLVGNPLKALQIQTL